MKPIPDLSPEFTEFRKNDDFDLEPETLTPDYENVTSSVAIPDLLPLNAQEADVPPKLLNNIEPNYPMAAMIANKGGKVLLKLAISKKGKVENVEVIASSGRSDLDYAALNAAKNASFLPAFLDNKPVEVIMTLTVDFTLQ